MAARAMPNGYNNPKAAEWLGDQMAADPRFAIGAVGFWYKALFHRERAAAGTRIRPAPDAAARLAAYNAQQEEFKELAARFAAGGYKVKDLLVDLMLSKQARANGIGGTVTAQRATALADIGSGTLLSAGRLNRKAIGCAGLGSCRFQQSVCRRRTVSTPSSMAASLALKIAQNFTSSQVTRHRRVCRAECLQMGGG